MAHATDILRTLKRRIVSFGLRQSVSLCTSSMLVIELPKHDIKKKDTTEINNSTLPVDVKKSH